MSVVQILVAMAALSTASLPPCPTETPGIKSPSGSAELVTFEWESRVDFDAVISWVDFDGQEKPSMVLTSGTKESGGTLPGHVYRVRTYNDELVKEVVIPHEPPFNAIIIPCDGLSVTTELVNPAKAAEFASLVHDQNAPCVGPSQNWSCIKKFTHEEYLAMCEKNKATRGFHAHETTPDRVGMVTDETYAKHIAMIPKTSSFGPGFVKMTMPKELRDYLLPWYNKTKNEATPHEPVGWVMNEDKIEMKRLNLDLYPEVHQKVVKVVQQVIQWWANMRVRHTSTYGVRVYTRDAMLLNHVDRGDTHLTSAILQVDQDVDDDGGWPLEVFLGNKSVGEVYLQPGEMLLYEGAWLRHGRPNRFRGNEFANIFTHYAPLDWEGIKEIDPTKPLPPMYHGYYEGRCDTVADEPPKGCVVNDVMESEWKAALAAQNPPSVGPKAGDL